jgi:RES domain-containing protein
VRFVGTVFRAHNPRWSFAPLSGAGAARYGGRFNRPGAPALYTSLRQETAWAEAQQAFPFKPQPLTLRAYAVDCDDVADLADPAEHKSRDIDAAELACAWEDMMLRRITPPTWEIADRLRNVGVAAIIAPSYAPGVAPGDRNLVFWRWSDAPPHKVAAIDDESRLPRDDSSWRSAQAERYPSARGTHGRRLTSMPSSDSASACSGVVSP